MTFEELKPKVTDILTDTATLRDEKLQKICHLLSDNIDYYDWVGFYFRNDDKEELILGPYVGPTRTSWCLTCRRRTITSRAA
jgi:GAF domain-containing protein